MFRSRNLALLGSLLLIVGAFLPVAPGSAANVAYAQNVRGAGGIILALGIASIVILFVWAPRLLWLTGLGAAGTLAAVFFDFRGALSEMMNGTNSGLGGNPFRGFGHFGAHATALDWGWPAVAAGALLIVVAAATSRETV